MGFEATGSAILCLLPVILTTDPWRTLYDRYGAGAQPPLQVQFSLSNPSQLHVALSVPPLQLPDPSQVQLMLEQLLGLALQDAMR